MEFCIPCLCHLNVTVKKLIRRGIALHAPGTIAAIAWFVHFGINMAMLQRRTALLAGTPFNAKTAWIICALLTGCVTPARLPTLDQVQASTPQALDSSDGQLSRKHSNAILAALAKQHFRNRPVVEAAPPGAVSFFGRGFCCRRGTGHDCRHL